MSTTKKFKNLKFFQKILKNHFVFKKSENFEENNFVKKKKCYSLSFVNSGD